jgi:CheY-like chemotaxis protein
MVPVHVLLIDDDEVDVEAVMRSLGQQNQATRITVFHDGADALEALRGPLGQQLLQGRYVILLDLRMPRMDGLQFLDALRSEPYLSRSIVFVLTTSELEEDMAAAYERNVAGYFIKSRMGKDLDGLTQLLEVYRQYAGFPTGERVVARREQLN